MKHEDDGRSAREALEAAKTRAEKNSAGRTPARYRLYDKIRDHVSLKTVDCVIAVTALLIVILLVYGILTASPPQ